MIPALRATGRCRSALDGQPAEAEAVPRAASAGRTRVAPRRPS